MNTGETARVRRLERLRAGENFDLVVIGGGATGCGIALDAASRGLEVALVEKNDFAEGTSGRSTKLVHGGVRYLERAVLHCDRVQYNLVRDGLRERSLLLKNAAHLANRLPLVTPIYRWRDIPYLFAGLKLYDILSGRRHIGHSRLLGRRQALRRFPTLKAEGLKAGVLYYDGQFHDARMALALALTAEHHGAAIANHVEVTGFLREAGRIIGVTVRDTITADTWSIAARGVINAAGPFVDRVRRLDEPAALPITSTSSGIHLALDGRFAPPDTGLMIPETEDGRVLFVLPWEGCALVGTTDEPAALSEHPRPQEEEIDYLLRHVSRYFNLQVTRADIRSAWSGLRPLIADPAATDTAALARDHVITVSAAGLVTIAGGKWTTYRRMAEDTVNHAIARFGLAAPHPACRTADLPLLGSAAWTAQGAETLKSRYGLDDDVAAYLDRTYGDLAGEVAQLALAGYGGRLAANHPSIEAEALYAARHELAERAIDLLARRTPLALLDRDAARAALPRVLEIMAGELGWDDARHAEEEKLALERLGGAL